VTDITFRDDMGVTVINSTAADQMVVKAARISTTRDWETSVADSVRDDGLIKYLMKNRHGTPFEHNAFTFRIECPIFVAREFMRHRIGWSYNEESGRYKELEPVFWTPAPSRPLVQEGKPGHYTMKPGTLEQWKTAVGEQRTVAHQAYASYKRQLEDGVAREVARAVLGTGIYTSFYATCNARSLMHFLSLRVDDPDSAYPSKPQYEIQEVAEQMEAHFQRAMPATWRAFIEAWRVAP
jgi:thymidylate synthase (FAD)